MAILKGWRANARVRWRRWLPALTAWQCMLLCIAYMSVSCVADDRAPTDNEIKAAFLFNFAKFTEWPADTLPAADSPIRIGVLGKGALLDSLEAIVKGKKIDQHPVLIESYADLPSGPLPQILFVSSSERRQLRNILNEVRSKPLLTVSDMEGFCEAGGVINFKLEGRKMRFEINNKAAERQKLKLSSKLLGVALRLVETGSEP
jgi:hypothetical protein